jgi:hypothetical protein
MDGYAVRAHLEVTVQDWRADVDHWWADVLRLPAAAIRAGGVYALDHVDHVGMVAVDGAAAPIVYGPPQVLPALHAAAPADGSDLTEVSPSPPSWGRGRAVYWDLPGTDTPRPRRLARRQCTQ